MKAFRRVWLGLVVLGSVAAPPAMAQGAEFSLGGGATLPLSDFGDIASTGWHGLAAVSYAPSTFPLGIQVDGMYQRLGFEGVSDDFDGNHQLIQGTVNAIYKFKSSPDSPVRPYIIGGVGLYNFKQTGDDVTSDESNTDFGVNAGAGFDFKLGSIGAFVEGRFHNVFGDVIDLRMIPITAGIRLGGN